MEQITLTPQQAAEVINGLFGAIVVRHVGAYSPDTDWTTHARSVAADLNARAGRTVLAVVIPNSPLSLAELVEWTNRSEFVPGEYQTNAVFEAIRYRCPAHGEAIASGRLIASAASSRRKDGPWNLYWLDKLPRTGAD